MAEPASVTGAVVAGAGAFVLTALGIEPAPLFWALVGACLGMSFAGASTRSRAALVFVCVVLVCSLFGAWLAVAFTGGAQLSRNGFACVLAIVFHPLLNAAITKLPEVIDGCMRRIGIGRP